MTILSLGNGVADVSSTVVSALSDSFELGIGETFGAGLDRQLPPVGLTEVPLLSQVLDYSSLLSSWQRLHSLVDSSHLIVLHSCEM